MKKKAEMLLTQAWQKQSPWLKVLAPLAKTYQWVGSRYKHSYEQGKKPIYRACVPVWVIGNITVGGSGKTPLIIALLDYLYAHGIRVGVISRGYGGDSAAMPRLVDKTSTPDEVGDEPCLIAQSLTNGQLAMAVCPKRGQAIDLLLQTYPDIQLIISDDGLQHYALHRDAEWIVVDVARGFGNQKLLPQGFLREPISRLEGAQVVYHYRSQQDACNSLEMMTMYLDAQALKPLIPTDALPPCNCSVYALTGIGYPKRFFDTLNAQGFIVKAHPKPDHHVFDLTDISSLQDLPIIITAKDAVKLQQLIRDDNQHLFEKIWVLPVKTVLSDGVYNQIDSMLDEWGIGRQAVQ